MCCFPTDTKTTTSSSWQPPPSSPTKKKKRVSFQDDDTVLTTIDTIAVDERPLHWYTKTELVRFKNEVRDLARRMRLRHCVEGSCCTRGLERRASLQRQRCKNNAIRDVLEAQLWGRSANEIASIAMKRSSNAKTIAMAIAKDDYHAVYHPELLNTTTEPMMQDDDDDVSSSSDDDNYDNDEIVHNKKRSLFSMPQNRNVRRRVSPPPSAKTVTASPWSSWRRRRVPMWQPEPWVTVSSTS